MPRAHEVEIADWRARHGAATTTWQAQEDLYRISRRHALLLAEADDAGALPLFETAEDALRACTSPTSGSEGLALMSEIYRLQGDAARLHERLGGREHLEAALGIWTAIAADPNRMGTFAEPEAARVAARLKGLGAPGGRPGR